MITSISLTDNELYLVRKSVATRINRVMDIANNRYLSTQSRLEYRMEQNQLQELYFKISGEKITERQGELINE